MIGLFKSRMINVKVFDEVLIGVTLIIDDNSWD